MKKSQLDRAIDDLNAQINVLLAAVNALRQQQAKQQKAKGPRAVPIQKAEAK